MLGSATSSEISRFFCTFQDPSSRKIGPRIFLSIFSPSTEACALPPGSIRFTSEHQDQANDRLIKTDLESSRKELGHQDFVKCALNNKTKLNKK